MLQGKVNGFEAKIVLDTGTDHCLVSPDLVKGLELMDEYVIASDFTGTVCKNCSLTQVWVEVDGCDFEHSAAVTPMTKSGMLSGINFDKNILCKLFNTNFGKNRKKKIDNVAC